jgi:N-acetylglucosamine kinase-like BadF-type ATPase
VARAADGRSPATRLTQAILEAWGLKAPGDLIPRVYQGQTGRTDIARLASLVEAVAGEGDEVAWEILRHAGRELALAVAAVTRRLGLAGPVPCAQGGGLLVKGRLVPVLFLEAAGALGLQLEPVSVVPEPAQGAVRLAVSLLKP